MLVSLEQIKAHLDVIYGFDIAEHSRNQSIVGARKVFINLAHRYGYAWKDISPIIEQKHDTCIYHTKTFSAIRAMDLHVYNSCIGMFNLPLQKYDSISSIDGNPTTNKIISNLTRMSRRDIKYFNDKIWVKYITDLAQEKSFTIEENNIN